MKTLELTPAEQELIKIKREQDELAARERVAKQAEKRELAIVQGKKRMEDDRKRAIRLEEHSIAFLKELNELAPGEYGLQRQDHVEKYELYDHEYDQASGKNEKIVYYTDSQKWTHVVIIHTPSGAKIVAHDYFQSQGDRWSSRQKYAGVRFAVTGTGLYDRKNDHLKSANTVNEKIQNAWESRQSREKKEKEKLEGFAWLIDHVNNLHPDALIEQKEESGGYAYGRKHWESGQKFIQATFPSGLVLNYFYDTREIEGQKVMVAVRRINIAGLSEEAKNEIVSQHSK